MSVERYLEDLENHLDETVEDDVIEQWLRFWDGGHGDPIFTPRRRERAQSGLGWPEVPVNEALSDLDRMVLQQYGGCMGVLCSGGGAILSVRANYGVGILPTLFGAELFVMDEELNTLPSVMPLGGQDRILAMLDAGIPELDSGLGGKVLEAGTRYAEIGRTYPRIGRYVYIYHPDLQGPIDVCELLWGSDIFLALLDVPELVHQCLELVVETYLALMRKWNELAPPRDTYNSHWGLLMKGAVCIRDDSAMNLSPDMFGEFIMPYNQKLLNELGGGMGHFCGRGDHFVGHMAQLDGLHAVNLSQPDCNDMEAIYAGTVDRGVKLLGLERGAAETALASGRDLKGSVHCW